MTARSSDSTTSTPICRRGANDAEVGEVGEGRQRRRGRRVGDWLEFAVSHPCTTFDKWPLIPVLDDDNRVVDLIRTYF